MVEAGRDFQREEAVGAKVKRLAEVWEKGMRKLVGDNGGKSEVVGVVGGVDCVGGRYKWLFLNLKRRRSLA